MLEKVDDILSYCDKSIKLSERVYKISFNRLSKELLADVNLRKESDRLVTAIERLGLTSEFSSFLDIIDELPK